MRQSAQGTCKRDSIAGRRARALLAAGCAALALLPGIASAQYTGPAELTAPTCGSKLLTGHETFHWDQVDATSYSFQIGTTEGAYDVYPGGGALPPKLGPTVTEVTPGGLSTTAVYWVRVRSLNPSSGKWDVRDCTVGPQYTGPAAISNPRCGAVLGSTTPTFTWPDVGALGYRLKIGGTEGSNNFYSGARLTAGTTSVTVPPDKALPADGRLLWVQLQSIDPSTGKWQNVNCQVAAVSPDLTGPGPVCNSLLEGPSTVMHWSANGSSSVQQWRFKAGTSIGGNQFVEQPWEADGPESRTQAIPNLPGDGSTVFVRLQWSKSDGSAAGFRDCKLLAATFPPPTLVGANVCNGILDSATPTFGWDQGLWNVTTWGLQVGSTPGGFDYYDNLGLGTATSASLTNTIPSDGRPVYVRLKYEPAKLGRTLIHDCVVTAPGAPRPPILTSPACGDPLPGSQSQIAWAARDSAGLVQSWQLLAGSTLGGSEYFDSGELAGDALTTLATGLPRDGLSLYMRLRWRQDGVWKSSDCLYPGYRTQNYAVNGVARRTTVQSCATTSQSNGKPMPLTNTVGCVNRTCVPPVPPIAAAGNLSLPRLGLTTKGSPMGEADNFTGTWGLTGNYVSVCDGKRTNETLATGNFGVTQAEDRTLSGKLWTVVIQPLIGCQYQYPAPGTVNFVCPDAQNIRCTVTCTPATDNCVRESTVSGVVGPDGAIAMKISHDQVLDWDCGSFGTLHMEDHQGSVDDPTTPDDEASAGLDLEFPTPDRIVN